MLMESPQTFPFAMPSLLRQTFRTDAGTAKALKSLAASERKPLPDILREAVRLRLDLGAVSDHVRVAVAEGIADAVAHAHHRLDAAGEALIARFAETESREREATRRDLADFIALLKGVVEADSEPLSASVAGTLTPRPSKRISS